MKPAAITAHYSVNQAKTTLQLRLQPSGDFAILLLISFLANLIVTFRLVWIRLDSSGFSWVVSDSLQLFRIFNYSYLFRFLGILGDSLGFWGNLIMTFSLVGIRLDSFRLFRILFNYFGFRTIHIYLDS